MSWWEMRVFFYRIQVSGFSLAYGGINVRLDLLDGLLHTLTRPAVPNP